MKSSAIGCPISRASCAREVGIFLAESTILLDDLELIPLVRPVSRGRKQRPQRPGRPALASNHLAHIVLGDFQFDHAVVELLDEHFVRRVDQPFRDQLKERTNISRRLRHKFSLWKRDLNSEIRGRSLILRFMRREPAPWLGPSNKSCSPAPTSARPSIPSSPHVRASSQYWPGWCGDCTFPPLPPDGHCAPAPSQSPQCGNAVVCAHRRAPVESLTRDVYPCSGRVRRGQDKLRLCRSLPPKGKHTKPNPAHNKMSS